MKTWEVIEARRRLYAWLYECRLKHPAGYAPNRELTAVADEPGRSAAISFGLELGHLTTRRSALRLTAAGMLFYEFFLAEKEAENVY